MKAENSMELIQETSNTVIISSELCHGLKTKRCAKCKRELPITSFTKKSSSPDGLQDMCQDCKREYMREYHARKKGGTTMEKIVVKKEEESHTMYKIYSDPELAKFQPRQLMAELKARGYRWEYMLEPQKKIYFDKI